MTYQEMLAAARTCSGPYCKVCPVCTLCQAVRSRYHFLLCIACKYGIMVNIMGSCAPFYRLPEKEAAG